MAKKSCRPSKSSCVGLKRNGRLKKGFKFRKGGRVVKVKKR